MPQFSLQNIRVGEKSKMSSARKCALQRKKAKKKKSRKVFCCLLSFSTHTFRCAYFTKFFFSYIKFPFFFFQILGSFKENSCAPHVRELLLITCGCYMYISSYARFLSLEIVSEQKVHFCSKKKKHKLMVFIWLEIGGYLPHVDHQLVVIFPCFISSALHGVSRGVRELVW